MSAKISRSTKKSSSTAASSARLKAVARKAALMARAQVLQLYIYSCSKRFLTFVPNRLSVIHDGSVPNQWRKVGTKENPADDVSWGLSGFKMVSSDRWKRGTEFLWQEECTWPKNPAVPEIASDDKVLKSQVKCCVAEVQCGEADLRTPSVPEDDEECNSEDPIVRFIKSYSCWHRLKKGVAWQLRCKNWLQAKIGKAERPPSVSADPLVPLELQAAEIATVGFVQRKHFNEELKALQSKGAVMKKSSIYLLEPLLDEEGILRVGDRLRNAPLSEKVRHPVIVPKNHCVSKLVVRRAHEFQSGHSGKKYVLDLIRQKFWIVGAWPLIKRVLKECMVCRKLRGNPQVQRMTDLPFDRVTSGKPPFSFVGVDCFGPFVVKGGRTQIKWYGCLFTCLTTQAVHVLKVIPLSMAL